MGPVTTGTMLGETFRLFGRGAGTLLGISLIVYSPFLLGSLSFFVVTFPQGLETLVQYASALIAAPIATAAMIHAVFQLARGSHATIADSLRAAVSRIWAVLGLSLLLSLVFIVGWIMCCVPGVVAYIGLFVAMPALMVERIPVFKTFDRSWFLTTDYKLMTFGVAVVLFLLKVALGAFVMVAGFMVIMASGFSSSLPAEAPMDSTYPDWFRGGFLLAGLLVEVPLAALTATAATVAYLQLRQTKEGLGEEELLAVFD